MKAISLFTGGKDSTYSIYEAKKQGFDVELLLSMNPEVKNSYLYHSKNIELTSLMADSMDMEIYEAKSRAKKEKEAEELKKAIKKVSREKNGFDSIIAGAIKSNYQKKRLHKIAKELDMDLYLPLWRINTKKYLKTLVKQDFELPEDKGDILEGKYLKILSIGWDYFGFLSQSQKIPDINGRIKVVDEIKKELKKLVESDLTLGNKIYGAENGIHFLITSDFNEIDDLKEKIFDIFNDKTKSILRPYVVETNRNDVNKENTENVFLSEILTEAFENLKESITRKYLDYQPNWVNLWSNNLSRDKFICDNCGKSYYCSQNRGEICDICEKIRQKEREESVPQTNIIDEIAWDGKDYGNMALLTLDFNLNKWHNGEDIESLFVRKYDKDKLVWLRDFYNSELVKERGHRFKFAPIVTEDSINQIKKTKEIMEEMQPGQHEFLKDIFFNNGVA